MSDTPLADATLLRQNEPAKIQQDCTCVSPKWLVNADELEAKKENQHHDFMRSTKSVSARFLAKNSEHKAWNIMTKTDEVNADDLQAYKKKHKASLMAQADHAVQACLLK